MKCLYLLLFLLPALSVICMGQDISPSQQAENYLDDKHVTVDHSTGIFRYKVPLYTLGNGSVQLPISLDYTARGVKVSDLSGLVGHNWNINTGGVVTRTIRGGIADEESFYGYLWADNHGTSPTLENDIERVNMRQRDGECDIFTAVFNGQSVSFILRMTSDHRIYTEPLERTNVRIECEYPDFRMINGWVITDEGGNRYIYRQKEWSVNIFKEDAISFNGIRNKSYISSWYLSRIEPANGQSIMYSYKEDVNAPDISETQDNISVSEYVSQYDTKYTYGSRIREWPMDFYKYRSDFYTHIARATAYLTSYSWEMQVNSMLNVWWKNATWTYKPSFDENNRNMETNFRIMGQLANFKNVSNASAELIRILNDLYLAYQNQPSQNAKMAASCFRDAKIAIIQCVTETRNVTTRETEGGMALSMRTPLLSEILCDNKMIKFNYQKKFQQWSLSGIKLCDLTGKRISGVYVEMQSVLKSLYFLDRDSVSTGRILFDYHQDTLTNRGWDLYGYFKRIRGLEGEQYMTDIDTKNSKIYSLKTITLPDGGQIQIDYESNYSIDKNGINYGSLDHAQPYGGIRLKSLVFDNSSGQQADTVYYRYPLPGVPIYSDFTNQERLLYDNFSDLLIHSCMKNKGAVYLNMGNNGIFYRYVQEVMPGRGTKAYLFHAPYETLKRPISSYSFWLNGLPLAVADYDNAGNLKRLIKKSYYTDVETPDPLDLYCSREYFTPCTTPMQYTRSLPQVQAFEYYMNEQKFEEYYRGQGIISFYSGGPTMDAYRDVYKPNVYPRISVKIPKQLYSLKYGGKTLLQREVEYRFDGTITNSPDVSDFSKQSLGTEFFSAEYFYDNPQNSIFPTRIVKTDSKGDKYTALLKRATEMDNAAASFIAPMKQANILTPIIKQYNLINGRLQKEQLFSYTCTGPVGRIYAGASKEYTYIPSGQEDWSLTSPWALDPVFLSRPSSDYTEERSLAYAWNDYSFFPVSDSSRSEQSAYCKDFGNMQTLLKANNVSSRSIGAVDLLRFNEAMQFNKLYEGYSYVYSNFKTFYNNALLLIEENNPLYQDYLRIPHHRNIIELIRIVIYLDKSKMGKLNQLMDSIRVNNYAALTVFTNNYYKLFRSKPGMSDAVSALFVVEDIISKELILSGEFYNTLLLGNIFGGVSFNAPIRVTDFPISGKMQLYILSENQNSNITCTVAHSGGRNVYNFRLSPVTPANVQVFDIDLSGYTGVTSLVVDHPYGVTYMAIVPASTPFEATSYNLDGTVYARFDHTRHLEISHYDASGRLIRLTDGNGNLLKTYNYHILQH